MEKYKMLKPISVFALEEAGACVPELYKFGYLAMKDYKYREEMALEEAINCASYCDGGIRFLIDKGFIAEDPVEMYSIGDRFQIAENTYILSAIPSSHLKKVILINLESGFRLGEGTAVSNMIEISKQEMKAIAIGMSIIRTHKANP